MSSWLDNLNEEQQKAVLHDHGPLLILAGAGSGKTTVLVRRAGRMVSEGICRADQLCVLTFTNKAAHELRTRVQKYLGRQADGLWAGTFHSFGLEFLRKFAKSKDSISILDQSDAKDLLKELVQQRKHSSKDAFDLDELLSRISTWREQGLTEAKTEDPYDEMCEWVLPKYLRRLELIQAVDFDSLILKPREMLQESPQLREQIENIFPFLMVDEFQDTNHGQMELVDLLTQAQRNLAVVGDDDQSIYGWRGAEVRHILGFPQRFAGCKVVSLVKNYRSTHPILELANHVILENKKRHPKVLESTKVGEGILPELFVYEEDTHEVEGIAQEILQIVQKGEQYKNIAVLFRSNMQAPALEGELRRLHIPYRVKGVQSLVDRKEIKDILAYLQCALRPHDVSLRRILNVPQRGMGETSLEEIQAWCREKDKTWRECFLNLTDFSPRVSQGLQLLASDVEKVKNCFQESMTPIQVVTGLAQTFQEIGYRSYLISQFKDPNAATQRWTMIEVFLSILEKFLQKSAKKKEGLRDFVESMSLRDEPQEEEQNQVHLLTLHASKGLEFETVFLMGIEEDLLPHRSLGGDVDEERRLFYVGITRAKEKLILSRTRQRKKFGKIQPALPSRFLDKVPERLIKTFEGGGRPMSEEQRRELFLRMIQKG